MKNEQLIYEAVAKVAVANRSDMTSKFLPLGAGETQKIDLKELATELCDAFKVIEERASS